MAVSVEVGLLSGRTAIGLGERLLDIASSGFTLFGMCPTARNCRGELHRELEA